MDKRNHFSDKFDNKHSAQLRSILVDNGYEKDAQLAAVWELERREEATEEDLAFANELEAERQRNQVDELLYQRYRTFWYRLIAATIDGFVLLPIAHLFAYLFAHLMATNFAIIDGIGSLLYHLIPYIYSILLHGYKGQTLGKMAMGIKVVNADDEEPIHMRQAFIRDSVPVVLTISMYVYSLTIQGKDLGSLPNFNSLAPIIFLSFLSLLWTLLEIISMLFNEKSRAVHDLLAKTVVVRVQ